MLCMFTAAQRRGGLHQDEMAHALSYGSAADTRLYRNGSGKETWIEGDLVPLFSEDGAHLGFLRIMLDVHDRYLSDETMRLHAQTDQLTGLLNRRAFYERLDQYIVSNARAHDCVIPHLIDLDLFKQVNDRLGHGAGDAVLREIAKRFCALTRESDYVARLGGDEFAILQTQARTSIDGSYLARKLVELCREPIRVHDDIVSVSLSIGMAVAPDDGEVPGELVRKADLALYRVKHAGRDNYCYFTQALDDTAKCQGERLQALRKAVQNRLFHLAYQPIVTSGDGQICRAEALLRCDHAALAKVPILEVLELLRSTGRMDDISHWIIGEACRDLRAWREQGLAPLRVAINLCARELSRQGTVDAIASALREHALEPGSLCVELTEHDVLDSKGAGLEVINALRAMGISISLDDFGTGFASMEYLISLPVDVLKLDRTFVAKLPDDPVTVKVVGALLGLAHSLGIRVVAEGVESISQREFLLEQQCDELQGYLISAPLNAAAFNRYRMGASALT